MNGSLYIKIYKLLHFGKKNNMCIILRGSREKSTIASDITSSCLFFNSINLCCCDFTVMYDLNAVESVQLEISCSIMCKMGIQTISKIVLPGSSFQHKERTLNLCCLLSNNSEDTEIHNIFSPWEDTACPLCCETTGQRSL